MRKKHTQLVVRSSDYTDGTRTVKGLHKRKVEYPKIGGLFKKNKDLYKLPLVLRKHIREWCEVNHIIMGIHEKHGDYIIWSDSIEGKDKLIRLYLNYFKSKLSGRHYVFAHNQMFQRRININNLMCSMNQVNEALDAMHFDEN